MLGLLLLFPFAFILFSLVTHIYLSRDFLDGLRPIPTYVGAIGLSDESIADREIRKHSFRSAEGKARCSGNAIKHGLTAKDRVVLDQECADQFEAMRMCLLEEMQIGSAVEKLLLEDMAAAAWRLRRIARIEKEMMEEDLLAWDGKGAGGRVPATPGTATVRAGTGGGGICEITKQSHFDGAEGSRCLLGVSVSVDRDTRTDQSDPFGGWDGGDRCFLGACWCVVRGKSTPGRSGPGRWGSGSLLSGNRQSSIVNCKSGEARLAVVKWRIH